MLSTIFATKSSMTQAWTTTGKRLAVTRLHLGPNMVVSKQLVTLSPLKNPKDAQSCTNFHIAYGQKKFKNMSKPLQGNLTRSGFKFGAKQLKGVRVYDLEEAQKIQPGETIKASAVLEVGDLVKVQGISKGKGFSGAVKRHGFHGGPKTHGQSDRTRAVGSIGSGTDPGRVWKGKKMPGHFGVATKSVIGLTVLYLNEEKSELWLSGPVPGAINSIVRISKLGKKKAVELDSKASGIEIIAIPEENLSQPVVIDKVESKTTEVVDVDKKQETKTSETK